ncbi:MAG TPA: nuclear transport factor 2 family protein [Ramlibacter sp.]|nr:nuclear transport factor 2 family protein [Ramlibacter sp.]
MKAGSDPLALIARYFEELESGNFEAAAACFAENVFYSHPPYRGAPPGSPRKEARNRAELLAQFRERGKRSVHHVYQGYVIGDRGFLSGTSTAPDGPKASFLSEFKVDGDGLIAYYVAYMSVPAAGSTPA